MTRVGIRRAQFLLVAAVCTVVLLAASLTATVRLAERTGPINPGAGATVVSASMPAISLPTTKKHCPRSGTHDALPACASTFSAVYHALEAHGWTSPLFAAHKLIRPGDEASLAQCNGTPPDRPPRFVA
jgi:hypothetical protein